MKSANQKLKLLYLYQILKDETDSKHGLTVSEIISRLDSVNISAERKSLYDDIHRLCDSGFLDIESRRDGNTVRYHVASRIFEPAELMLLSDAVQSAKFISNKKSSELIKKLMSLTSEREARRMNLRFHSPSRVKTDNMQVIEGVAKIGDAILDKVKISFKYTHHIICGTAKGYERREKHAGKKYVISPYELIWDDENYYMVGYDDEAGIKKHYRVDRMTDIVVTGIPRSGERLFYRFNATEYCRSAFSMFSGEELRVELECDNDMIEVIIDRFGKDIVIRKKNLDCFGVSVRVMVSPVFFSWVFTFGGKVRIISPDEVVEKYAKQTKSVLSTIKFTTKI